MIKCTFEDAIGYVYDGTPAGFYCCVHESVYTRQIPFSIEPENTVEPSLFSQKHILTDMAKARKVRNSVYEKISPRALAIVETVFYSCLENKELRLLRFLLLGYELGGKIDLATSHVDVNPLLKAEKSLYGEAHLFLGFVRFTDHGGMLSCEIAPKNFVLPFIAEHFCDRFSNENFIIYDKTHNAALIYSDKKRRIMSAYEMTFNKPVEEEEHYQELWKRFCKTISIEARENPRCQLSHMPNRYRDNMIEMRS